MLFMNYTNKLNLVIIIDIIFSMFHEKNNSMLYIGSQILSCDPKLGQDTGSRGFQFYI